MLSAQLAPEKPVKEWTVVLKKHYPQNIFKIYTYRARMFLTFEL